MAWLVGTDWICCSRILQTVCYFMWCGVCCVVCDDDSFLCRCFHAFESFDYVPNFSKRGEYTYLKVCI